METPKNLLNNNQSAQKQLASTPEKKMLPEGEGGGKKWWMLVLGFILIVVLFWVFWGKDSDDVAPKNEENNASVTEENNTANIEVTEKPPVNTSVGSKEAVVVSGNNKVSVKDQPAGSVVEVEGLELSVVAWVAVHEERNGGLGNILGARRFEPGIHLGEVELLRNTTAGGVYHAVLYKDNGDRQFDKATDQLMKNDSGVVIESVFKAQ
jgi:cbb3-type cytochrome oxidase subunit 3